MAKSRNYNGVRLHVFEHTHLPEMLRLGRSRVDSETRIIVTHGTDTMVDTARALGAALPPSESRNRRFRISLSQT